MRWSITIAWRLTPGRWGWGRGAKTGLRHLYLGRLQASFGTHKGGE